MRSYCTRHDCHPLDAIIEHGVMSEHDLLSYLASVYKTPFVSSDQVRSLRVRSTTLQTIGDSLAEQLGVLPVKYEVLTQSLSILGYEPQKQVDIAKQVQLASGARRVNYYIARPSVVRRALEFHYWGGPGFGQPDPIVIAGEAEVEPAPEMNLGSVDVPAVTESTLEASPLDPSRTSDFVLNIEASDLRRLVTTLVTLAERRGAALRGHAAQVSAFAAMLCEKMRLSAEQKHAICLAASLHDVGKPATHHLTALNVAQYPAHQELVQRAYKAPLHTLESVPLPAESVQALTHFYERFDGKGLPDGLAGSAIPLGARILALADSYADLTSHSKNAFGRQLNPSEGLKGLARFAGSVFDPTLHATLKQLVLGEEVQAQLRTLSQRILVIETDPEESLVLEMRLSNKGYRVVEARSSDEALDILKNEEVHAIISGVDLAPLDGLGLMQHLREGGTEIPTIFLSHRNESGLAKRALDMGAVDYILKPTSAEVVIAKLDQALNRLDSAHRGVAGSLNDMSLSDVVQVLSGGAKTGCLSITTKSAKGRIQFVDGDLWSAQQGSLRGPEAFFAMLALTDGEFEFDPAVSPGARNLTASPQALLLEAMRHLDEGLS